MVMWAVVVVPPHHTVRLRDLLLRLMMMLLLHELVLLLLVVVIIIRTAVLLLGVMTVIRVVMMPSGGGGVDRYHDRNDRSGRYALGHGDGHPVDHHRVPRPEDVRYPDLQRGESGRDVVGRRRRMVVMMMMVRIRWGGRLVHHLGWVGIPRILMMHRGIVLMLRRIVQRWVVRHLGVVMLLMMMHLRNAEASRTPPGIHEFHDGIGE